MDTPRDRPAPTPPRMRFGAPVRRIEDRPLLIGASTYVADVRVPGMLDAAFVRSTIGHGRIRAVDTTAARAMPGVVAVYTAEDLDPPLYVFPVEVHVDCRRPSLARERVRFVGELVAIVVADTRARADDAAEAVVVTYDPWPVVVDPERALGGDAPTLFASIGSNLVAGERSADTADVLDDAEVVVRGRFENQRLAVVPIECSAIAVVPARDPQNGPPAGHRHDLTVYLSTQFPHMSRTCVASAFGLEPDTVRVVAPDVGGGFGGKMWAPEHVVVIAAARVLGRAVRWIETRSENLASMAHGRAQVQYVELGLRRDGHITGLRCRMIGDSGAYGGFGGILARDATYSMSQGPYRIPRLAYDVAVAVTNTAPTGAFRGAGRPEAAAFLERIMDIAADELDIDPVELRRRNLLEPSDFPVSTHTGVVYDSGDYAAALAEALRLVDYDARRAEQAARRASGHHCQIGIGVAVYVEITGGALGSEFSEVEVHPDGTATVKVGTSSHGQGHATVFSTLVADRLGLPLDAIRFVQSDTAAVLRGGGTGGSRSGQVGGSAVSGAVDAVIARGREIAAGLLEARPDDIVVAGDGGLGVAGVPATSIPWATIATHAAGRGEPLVAQHDFSQTGATFPFGAHVSVVEVDLETGLVIPRRFIAVDDCGRILNPLIVDGQVHGGVASGISQALWEQVVYDDNGNLLTSSLAEYAMPSAAELPSFELAHTQTPSPRNPLGAKGIGESGTVGATPATQNAVVDALAHLGVRHVDMPCSPERVLRAIDAARAGHSVSSWREPPDVFSTLPVRPERARAEIVNL